MRNVKRASVCITWLVRSSQSSAIADECAESRIPVCACPVRAACVTHVVSVGALAPSISAWNQNPPSWSLACGKTTHERLANRSASKRTEMYFSQLEVASCTYLTLNDIQSSARVEYLVPCLVFASCAFNVRVTKRWNGKFVHEMS